MSRNLNIGFISTRFAGTDGVTLEAEKWADVGSGNPCHVALVLEPKLARPLLYR